MNSRANSPRFSLVIPAYNESALLPRLLRTVQAARERYTGGADAIEVIVADNASTDDTAAIARAHGCRVAFVEKRVIAASRNGGAALAGGEVICFVDADMQVHPQTFNAIDRALATGRAAGGATGVVPDRWSAGLAITIGLMTPLAWLTGIDTGVVYLRRDDFIAIGGYDETRPYAEDVALMMALKRLGRRRRQRLMHARGARAIASTRKFDRFGDWHFFTMFWKFGIDLAMGRRGKTARVEQYWYRDR